MSTANNQLKRAENASRLFSQQGTWHKNQWSSVGREGASGTYDQVYGFTLLCSHYPSHARYIYEINRTSNGIESFEFQLLMGFLHCLERMHKDLIREQSTPSDPNEQARAQAHVADNVMTQEMYNLHLEQGNPIPPGTRVVDARGHELVQLRVPHHTNNNKKKSIDVYLEEVHYENTTRGPTNGFPEYQWLKNNRTPACYTIWVLVNGMDFNTYWMQMLRSNFNRISMGAMSTVKMYNPTVAGVSITDVVGAERSVASDNEREGSVHSEEEDNGNQNQGRRARGRAAPQGNNNNNNNNNGNKSSKRKAETLTTNIYMEPKKRVKKPGTHEFEVFRSLTPLNLPKIVAAYTRSNESLNFHSFGTPITNIGFDRKDPCNVNNLFSVFTALEKRPVNVDRAQSFLGYAEARRDRLNDKLPYCPVRPTEYYGNDRPKFKWRTPVGKHASFWRLGNDMQFMYPAHFALKHLPYAQDYSSVLQRVWPGIFGPRSTGRIASGRAGGLDTVERRHNIGPDVAVPIIAGIEMTQERMFELYSMVTTQYEDVNAALVQLRLDERHLGRLMNSGTINGNRICASDETSRSALANSLMGSCSNGSFALLGSSDRLRIGPSSGSSSSCSSTNLTMDDNEVDEMMDSSQSPGAARTEMEEQYGFSIPSGFSDGLTRPRSIASQDAGSGTMSIVPLRGVLVQFDSRTAEMDELSDSIANLYLCANQSARSEIIRKTREMQDQMAAQRAYLASYKELSLQRYTGWGRDNRSNNDDANQALHHMIDAIQGGDKQFDAAVLLNQYTADDIFALQGQRLALDSRAALIKRLSMENTNILKRLRELIDQSKSLRRDEGKHMLCISPVEQRSLYYIHQKSSLVQYEALVAQQEADIPYALRIMYRIVIDQDLYRPNRMTFRRIIPNMSVLGNMLCMSMEQIEVTYCCSKPHLALRGFLSSLSATRYCNRLKSHEMWFGGQSASKSCTAGTIVRMRCNDGKKDIMCTTTEEITSQTEKANNVDNGALGNFTLRIFHEMNSEMLMGKDGKSSGNSDWKILLDDGHISTKANVYNEITQQFEPHMRESEQQNAYLFVTNDPRYKFKGPLGSRTTQEEFLAYRGQACSILRSMRREMNMRPSDELKAAQLDERFHTLHALHAEIDMLIKLTALADVTTWMVGYVVSFVNDRLTMKNLKEIQPRMFMNIEQLARTLCIQEVLLTEFFTYGGMFYGKRIERRMLLECDAKLFVSQRHVISAFGLLVRNCFIQGAEDVRILFNSMIRCAVLSRQGNINAIFERDYSATTEQHHNDQQQQQQQRQQNRRAQDGVHSEHTQDYRPGHNSYANHFNTSFGDMDENSNQSAPPSPRIPSRPAPARDSYASNQNRSYGNASDRNNNGGARNENIYNEPRDKAKYWHNFDFVTVKRNITNDREEHKFKQLAQLLHNQLSLTDIKTEYTVDSLTSILDDLSEISRKCPHYVKHDRSDTTSQPVPSDNGQQVAISIVSECGMYYRISYDWLQQIDADPVENVKQALIDLNNFKYQPYELHTWTPNKEFPNTLDTFAVGNVDCFSDDLEVLVNDNPSYLPPEELFALYYDGEMEDNKWKLQKGTRVDMSYDAYAAQLRSLEIMAHASRTTERDVVRSLYTAQRLLNKQDPESRYHGFVGNDVVFRAYDGEEDVDMPESSYMVPCKMEVALENGWSEGGARNADGHPLVHHADLLFGKTFPDDPLARRVAYKKDSRYTLPHIVNNRMGYAEEAYDVVYESYPDVFRKRFETDPGGSDPLDVVNMSDLLTNSASGLNEFSKNQLALIGERTNMGSEINQRFAKNDAELRRRRMRRIMS